MICTEWPCGFKTDEWKILRVHYKEEHPKVKRPDKYFTKEARNNEL